jgi:hypothetical protein
MSQIFTIVAYVEETTQPAHLVLIKHHHAIVTPLILNALDPVHNVLIASVAVMNYDII